MLEILINLLPPGSIFEAVECKWKAGRVFHETARASVRCLKASDNALSHAPRKIVSSFKTLKGNGTVHCTFHGLEMA